MPNLGPTELIILVVVLVLLFGAKKLPDAARSLGRSMRIFKSEVKEMQNDGQPQAIEQQPIQAQPIQAQPIQPQPIQQPQPVQQPTQNQTQYPQQGQQ